MDLERNILEFLHGDEDAKTPGRGPRDRYASFDYCFNYFQSFREADATEALAAPEHAQTSCLHLGFYLASWGMLCGSSFLLRKSLAIYEPVVRAISSMDRAVWETDAHCYTDANLAILLECSEAIGAAFGSGNCPSDALVTKVMLGVFGNVPAFDSFVRMALGELLGVRSFGKRSLRALAGFYEIHREVIERHVALSFVACSLTTLLLAQRDDQQTVGEIRRALQGAALLAWLFRVMGKTALHRRNHLLHHLRHPLLQGMAGV